MIAFSDSSGCLAISGAGNQVLGNSIHDNALLGIDLAADGVTANDSGDADTGPNDRQNFPVLTSAVLSGGTLTVNGTLSSAPSTTYRVEVFYNPTCDGSGYGEGGEKRGFVDVTTNASGSASFTASSAGGTAANGGQVTATATDPNGNTSEFSACSAVTGSSPNFTIIGVDSAGDDAICNGGTARCAARIELANVDPGTETIKFAIGTGAAMISPHSALPIITGPVILDATTQPGMPAGR